MIDEIGRIGQSSRLLHLAPAAQQLLANPAEVGVGVCAREDEVRVVARLAHLQQHREHVCIVIQDASLRDEGVELDLGLRAQRIIEITLLRREEQPLDVHLARRQLHDGRAVSEARLLSASQQQRLPRARCRREGVSK